MISLHDVTKSYVMKRGLRRQVVSSVNLEVPWRNIAVLGRNGAGKSTLLRMISGIEPPDSGHISRKGSISWPIGFRGSFHRDLSGIENVRFVARIFGQDTRRVVAFVRDFAEIGPAFWAPIKTYSTGMAARLAFGVSMAINFDIYVIDELMAVGDPEFQQKCRDAFRQKVVGSRLIMASHAPGMLREFCDAAIVLQGGRLRYFDDLEDALEVYGETVRRS